ncbi:CoA transferase [Streptomyces sp. INA 01156]
MTASLPLEGVRVLDLSTVFMGPYAAQILAGWGADVIKVEALEGDQVRGIGDVGRTGLGPIFINANGGKRSLALDLKAAGAREVLHALVRRTDLLLHNVRPPAAARLGITWEDLSVVNPSLVHCAFRGYGAACPWADPGVRRCHSGGQWSRDGAGCRRCRRRTGALPSPTR